ncbi:hypothetical protein MARPU_15200 [Marichromatium purpuratum 984]|uniref:Uncharacterized protein n=1 Tax=Marichromatium purpuratum 984 TaxID=765910 RepID=W0E8S3_MARPU|nr:hypothetical protein MARPU_15200 [Marichromatium purpuratum 984]
MLGLAHPFERCTAHREAPITALVIVLAPVYHWLYPYTT